MEQIGFCQQIQRNDDWLKEQLIVWPERSANLTLEKRRSLIGTALGVPLPKILRPNPPVYKDDKLVFECVDDNRFRQEKRQEILVVHRTGALSFERWLVWQSVGRRAYDGGEFAKLIIGNSLRGINFASTVQSEGTVVIEMRVSGLFGSRLIFNPHHERCGGTTCIANKPICRQEAVHIGGSYSAIEQIKELTFNLTNELLGSFQLSGSAEYLPEEEFDVLFDAEAASLKFSTGIFARKASLTAA